MGQDPVLSKHIFVTWYSWGTVHTIPTQKKSWYWWAGSTIVQALCVNYYFFTWYSWGTVHKIPPQLFTLWKLYFFTWYSWGRIHDCPSTLCKLLFFSLDTHGARSTKSHPNFSLCENYIFSLDTHGAGSTIVQALCVNYYFFTWYSWGTVHDCPSTLCKLYFFHFFFTFLRFTKSHPNFYFFYILFFFGAGSTIVQALCVNYYFFTWYSWGTVHKIPPQLFTLWKLYFLTWYSWGRIHDCPSTLCKLLFFHLILMGHGPRLSKHFV